MNKEADQEFMALAIELSAEALDDDVGGPFGAIVVRDGQVVGRGRNRVLADGDPTAHAEVLAIRDACRSIGDHRLTGCVVYTSSEPCPMCLAALNWARVDRVLYANVRSEAAAIGFDDEWLYLELAAEMSDRKLPMSRWSSVEARAVFDQWFARDDRIPY
ncbi:MAG TPA: nucleoside deaminase [Actinomycetota bacterium]|nr:nucleoside deaminase [Actinomycetota bacterium]